MKNETNSAWEWRVETMLPFEVVYGGSIPESLPVAMHSILRQAQGNRVHHLHASRKESRECRSVRVQGAIALLPKGGTMSDELYEVDEHLPALKGFVPADVYDLVTWLRDSARRNAGPDILFAPTTYMRTQRGCRDVLCAAKCDVCAVTYHFYNITQLHMDSQYGSAMVGGAPHDWLFKDGKTAGVLYVKQL